MSIVSSSMILYRNVDLTDQMKFYVEYDLHRHQLNIFVNSTDPQYNQIHVFVNQPVNDSPMNDVETKFCLELSTIYTYDEIDEEIVDVPPSILSSCCDDFGTDHDDDGYSTHSSDDIEHSASLVIPTSKSFLSFDSTEFYPTFVTRLIEQMISFNPLRKTIEKMMFHPFFFH